MSDWNHADVVMLLYRETSYAYGDIEYAVLKLAALGWTQHQVRKGILAIARSRGTLYFDSLWRGSELAGGDVDRFLEALARAGEGGSSE